MPEGWRRTAVAQTGEDQDMSWIANSFVNFVIFLVLMALLMGCASGPSAEPVACRGSAFSINPPSSLAPAAPVAMAETETAR